MFWVLIPLGLEPAMMISPLMFLRTNDSSSTVMIVCLFMFFVFDEYQPRSYKKGAQRKPRQTRKSGVEGSAAKGLVPAIMDSDKMQNIFK